MRHKTAEHGVQFKASQNIYFEHHNWKLDDPKKINWKEFLENDVCFNCTIFGQFGQDGFPDPQNVFNPEKDQYLQFLSKLYFKLKANLVTSHNPFGLAPHVHFSSHLILFEGEKEWYLSRPEFFFKNRKKQMKHPQTMKCFQREKEMIFVPQFWAHSVINHGFTFAVQLTGNPLFFDVDEFKIKQRVHEKWYNF